MPTIAANLMDTENSWRHIHTVCTSIKFTVRHLQSRPQAFAEEEGSLQFLQKVGKRLR